MEQRLSFVTLAVADLAAVREFYLDGLGWTALFDDSDEVVMVQVADHLVLSFWHRDAFAAEVGVESVGGGVPPITLAHNVIDKASVDRVLARAAEAGAQVSSPADRVWGGYSGYFTDPDGFRWEVCWNPGDVGQLVLPDVSQEG